MKPALAGVCSLLPADVSAQVRGLWEELERDIGLKSGQISPLPHFSYQVARDYDLDVLQDVVGKLAAGARPMRVQTAGLGIFSGASPVLHIPIARSPELARFQIAVWSAASVAATKLDQHYHPASWVPHISLAFGDTTSESIARAVECLAERDLSWDVEVDNLAVIRGVGHLPQELVATFPLQGVARNF